MRIEVTDSETGNSQIYALSRDNWGFRWACMIGESVIMWAPVQLEKSPGSAIRCGGRVWKVTD